MTDLGFDPTTYDCIETSYPRSYASILCALNAFAMLIKLGKFRKVINVAPVKTFRK